MYKQHSHLRLIHRPSYLEKIFSNLESLRQSIEQASKQKALESRKLAQQSVPQTIMNGIKGDRMDVDPMSVEAFDDQPSVPKRLKTHHPSPSGLENDMSVVSNYHVNSGFALQETQPEQLDHNNKTSYLKREVDAKADMRAPQKPIKISYGIDGNLSASRCNVIPGVPSEINSHIKQENLSVDKETSETALEVKNETNGPTDATVSKSGKPNVNVGNIKFVLYLMEEGTMEDKLNILAPIAMLRRSNVGYANLYHRVLLLGQNICRELFLVII
jgi:hypothetical protein|uniref:Uncharacterized protein n=1 Tax=Zea mays TaxID=4577 RepID=A0A804NFC6_MAIZE